jgi:hypothetical protein
MYPDQIGIQSFKEKFFPSPQIGGAIDHDMQRLNRLTSDNPVLFTLSSVFPLDMFPTKITVEKNKVSVVSQLFFFSQQVQSILIREISQVEVDVSLFFATLQIRDRVPNHPVLSIPNLKVREALRAQRIIQGLMTGLSQNIDISQMPVEELRVKLEQLGGVKVFS